MSIDTKLRMTAGAMAQIALHDDTRKPETRVGVITTLQQDGKSVWRPIMIDDTEDTGRVFRSLRAAVLYAEALYDELQYVRTLREPGPAYHARVYRALLPASQDHTFGTLMQTLVLFGTRVVSIEPDDDSAPGAVVHDTYHVLVEGDHRDAVVNTLSSWLDGAEIEPDTTLVYEYIKRG